MITLALSRALNDTRNGIHIRAPLRFVVLRNARALRRWLCKPIS